MMVAAPSMATSAGVSVAGVIHTCWLKAARDPEVMGISRPALLLVVSTTSNYLEMGPNGTESQMGTNILILTRNPAQVMATLYHLQRGRRANPAQHSSSAHVCVGNLQAKRLPTNTNKNVKIHSLHLVLYSSLKYMTKLCSNMSGEAI